MTPIDGHSVVGVLSIKVQKHLVHHDQQTGQRTRYIASWLSKCRIIIHDLLIAFWTFLTEAFLDEVSSL